MSDFDSITFNWRGWDWYAYKHCKNDTENCKDAYLSTNCVVTNNNTIKLPINYNPKKFPNDKLNTIRTYECAFIESSKVFSYGTYEFDVILDNSPNTWPAIWLYGANNWPPEIDVVEAYPRKNGKVINITDTKWETNIHYDDNGAKQYGAKGIPTLLYLLTHKQGKPDTWKLVWTPEYIKIYFNGIRVRYVNDKKVINHFNANNKMRVVVNNMLQKDYNKSDYEKQENFELTNFKYTPYINKKLNK